MKFLSSLYRPVFATHFTGSDCRKIHSRSAWHKMLLFKCQRDRRGGRPNATLIYNSKNRSNLSNSNMGHTKSLLIILNYNAFAKSARWYIAFSLLYFDFTREKGGKGSYVKGKELYINPIHILIIAFALFLYSLKAKKTFCLLVCNTQHVCSYFAISIYSLYFAFLGFQSNHTYMVL